MIPSRIIRSVPATTTDDVEEFWRIACEMHPDWLHDTYRDPVDPAVFPLTSDYWSRCSNGAQLAGLIRLEALWWGGGIWLDSDVQLFKPLDTLLQCDAFGCFEDETIVPDAVIGATARHPAIKECIDLAIARITGKSGEPKSWMTDQGAWSTGPGVTTTVFKRRNDVLLLPPDAFFPVHYAPRETLGDRLLDCVSNPKPWSFGVHRWNWSWR